jgi:hypothetical protein
MDVCLDNGTPTVVVPSTVELEDMEYGFRKYQMLYLVHRKGRFTEYEFQKEGPCVQLVN